MTASQPKVVLLAEDDEVNREIVRHILSALSFIELVEARDGRQALELALERKFDLMIFDQNMPHIRGDRVVRHLKASRTPNTQTPVIQFTADATRAIAQPAQSRLWDAVLPKPLRAGDLIDVVQRLLG